MIIKKENINEVLTIINERCEEYGIEEDFGVANMMTYNYALENINNGFSSTASETSYLGGVLGNLTNQVGESSQALSLLGITGASSIKRIAVGLKALGKLFTTWPLVAIVAIITVVATVVAAVVATVVAFVVVDSAVVIFVVVSFVVV